MATDTGGEAERDIRSRILRRRYRARHWKANRKKNLEWGEERGAWADDWFPIGVVSKGMAVIVKEAKAEVIMAKKKKTGKNVTS